ncbi:type II toxin-antitoxin system VapC family toxin [Nitrosospira multiformis]|uniref:type II toxin-antitoxin system VapC family toxin n=1 Tax=Nitrosospira multiformis TaxID=1231 RepID=UPI00094439DA|nr:type II toxin-antitoxin system VapC family toxin [Nitrosospira multiformis]
MDITIDSDTDTFAGSTTLRLAQRCELTLYNAAYLELAQRFELPLTTLNQELRTAGNTLGLTLLAQ